MNTPSPPAHSESAGASDAPDHVPVVEERLRVDKRTERAGIVRVRVEVEEQPETIAAQTVRQHVEVQRIARDEVVEQTRPPWTEGAALVVPVYEERVVLSRQWVLKEEIHLLIRSTTERSEHQTKLKRERAVVERQEADGSWHPVAADSAPAVANSADADHGGAASSAPLQDDIERKSP